MARLEPQMRSLAAIGNRLNDFNSCFSGVLKAVSVYNGCIAPRAAAAAAANQDRSQHVVALPAEPQHSGSATLAAAVAAPAPAPQADGLPRSRIPAPKPVSRKQKPRCSHPLLLRKGDRLLHNVRHPQCKQFSPPGSLQARARTGFLKNSARRKTWTNLSISSGSSTPARVNSETELP